MPEDLLRKYRPVGPPPDLRGRILEESRPAWRWAAAAAALLVTTLALQTATWSRSRELVDVAPEPRDADARIAYITDALGGSDDARRTAAWIVLEEELRIALPPVSTATVPAEGQR